MLRRMTLIPPRIGSVVALLSALSGTAFAEDAGRTSITAAAALAPDARSSRELKGAPAPSTSFVSGLNLSAGFGITGIVTHNAYAEDNGDAKIGFASQLTFDLGRGPFVVETGVGYLRLGSDRSTGFFYPTPVSSLDLSYVTIPILAKFYAGRNSGRGVFIRGGFIPSFLVAHSGSISIRNYDSSPILTSAGDVNKFDLLATAGVGWNITLAGSTALIIATDVDYGLVNLNRDLSGNARATNLSFSFLTGLAFTL